MLQSGGIYISSDLGYMAQNVFLPVITPIIKLTIGEGKFKAVIDRKYPLERIVEAYRYVEKGQKTGNVVITV